MSAVKLIALMPLCSVAKVPVEAGPRLGEFRHIMYGELPEFVPFESEESEELLHAYANDLRCCRLSKCVTGAQRS
jgi:hypothetical protein